MLEKETIAIEFWRKRYLRQAIIVIILLGGMATAAICFFSALVTQLFCLAAALLIIYHMLRELYADLQTRGEVICVSQPSGVYENLHFDVGRGIDEKVLENMHSFDTYQARECRNVMFQEGIHIEEDLLYNIISAKFGRLQQVVFEGIVLVFDLDKNVSYAKGEAIWQNDKIKFNGGIPDAFHNQKIYSALIEIMKFFQVLSLKVEIYQDKIYFFIPTHEKIFFQFSLFKHSHAEKFVHRVLQLKTKTENLYKALND